MYCYLNVKSQHPDIQGLIMNFNAQPKRASSGTTIYIGKLRNLRFWMNDEGEYSIQGSIWTYSHGNNYGIFNEIKFKEALTELDSLTFGTFSSGNVIGLECGINIPTKHNPLLYINQMTHSTINNRIFPLFPLYSQNKSKGQKQWGVSSLGVQSGYKVYSKTEEANLDHNVLRVEYYIKNVKAALGTSIITNQLYNTQLKEKLWSKLDAFISNMSYKVNYDPTTLNKLRVTDKMRYLLLCSIQHKNVTDVLSILQCNYFTARRERKHLNALIELINEDLLLHNDLIQAYNAINVA